MKRTLVVVTLLLIVLFVPLVRALELPLSKTIGPFRVTVDSYALNNDNRGGSIYGSISSGLWFEIHVISAYATVSSTEYLGRADLQGTPILKPDSIVSTSAVLSSPYTLEQFGSMRVSSVTVHAEIRYCGILAFGWCGPVPIPWWYLPASVRPFMSISCDFTSCTMVYERTLTSAEIEEQLAQEFA